MRLFSKDLGRRPARSYSLQARPVLEELETRLVPYAASGNGWPSPQLVTLSFMPDGTLETSGVGGSVTSNLFSKFNGKWSTQTWENAIITAAQTWAQYTNINFTVVSDNGTSSGGGLFQQGDPGMGDIRFGGYNLNNSSYLALGYMPPPVNNYSIAGDINFNTAQTFNINTTYDLETVAMHEIGHALGLNHTTISNAVMYPNYHGVMRNLTNDDINGIQALYGARTPDAYNTGSNSNGDFSTATPVGLNFLTGSGQLNNLNIDNPNRQEFFTFTAPLLTSSNISISVQSAGLSLLRPSVTVFAADQQTVLGSAYADTTVYNGSTLNIPLSGVTPGQTFYVEVTAADYTAFDVGNYAMSVDTGILPMPAVVPPSTTLLNGLFLHGGGGLADSIPATTLDSLGYADLMTIPTTSTLPTGVFNFPGFTPAASNPLGLSASNSTLFSVLTNLEGLLAQEVSSGQASGVFSKQALSQFNFWLTQASKHTGTAETVDLEIAANVVFTNIGKHGQAGLDQLLSGRVGRSVATDLNEIEGLLHPGH